MVFSLLCLFFCVTAFAAVLIQKHPHLDVYQQRILDDTFLYTCLFYTVLHLPLQRSLHSWVLTVHLTDVQELQTKSGKYLLIRRFLLIIIILLILLMQMTLGLWPSWKTARLFQRLQKYCHFPLTACGGLRGEPTGASAPVTQTPYGPTQV